MNKNYFNIRYTKSSISFIKDKIKELTKELELVPNSETLNKELERYKQQLTKNEKRLEELLNNEKV